MSPNAPLITLTTDFGHDSPYVAAMKGVILGINPAARLVDLCHEVPPQDVRHAAFILAAAVPYFPADALHVVVVDPGVGSDRALLYVETGKHRLLAPDNGCWTPLLADGAAPVRVIRLAEPRYWRQPVSATFHGRDILAPVAGHLSLGLAPEKLGPEAADWVRLPWPSPTSRKSGMHGEVLFVDRFGNLITNIPAESVRSRPTVLVVGKRKLRRGFRWVRTYAEAEPGQLVALISSFGTLEVAVVQGNAAKRLGAAISTAVSIGWGK